MFHRTPCLSAGAPLQGRTCVSDTLNDGPATAATDSAATANGNGSAPRRRTAGGLAGKLLPELQQLAGDLGITGTARMRKSELIAAIQERQGGGASRSTGEQAAPSQRGRSGSASRRGSQEAAGRDEPPSADGPRSPDDAGARQRDDTGARQRDDNGAGQRDDTGARQRDG